MWTFYDRCNFFATETTSRTVMRKSIPTRKTYVVSEHTPLRTKKASKLKTTKETRQLFERIAKSLVDENALVLQRQLENFCRDQMNKHFSEIRHDLLMMESTLSARISHLETKMLKVDSSLGEHNTQLTAKVDKIDTKLEDYHNGTAKMLSDGLETERGKRLALVKKIQNQFDNLANVFEKRLSDSSKDTANSISILNQDLASHSREIVQMREKIDDM